MKAKTFSTSLKDLYGINGYQLHIHVDDEYWVYSELLEQLTHEKWNKIKVTYIRSEVMFFNIIGHEDIPEQYFPINSLIVPTMIVAKLDPLKDLNWDNLNPEYYRFDDTRTEVVNFDNSPDKEVPDYILL